MLRIPIRAAVLAVLVLASISHRADSEPDASLQTEKDWIDDRWSKTDVGQFLGSAVQTPRHMTYKGVTVKLGDQEDAAVCFDTDLLRYSAGWTGGFLKTEARRYGKPMYPFLWMYYHDSNATLKGQLLPRDTWQMELDTVRRQASGTVIWGGWQTQWTGSNADWWTLTTEFLRRQQAAQ